MLEILRDPVWQFIGAVLAVLGIVVALGIYWLQRQTKELAFGIVSSRRLLSIADELSSRVTVELDGQPVKNLHLLVYGLKNSGHRSVSSNDFLRALKISFPEGQVVSAEIASQDPSNLGATLLVAESSVELRPFLLNAGDKILIQVLLSAISPSESVDARIVDVPNLVPIDTRQRLPPFLDSMMPLSIGTCLLLALVSYIFDFLEESLVFLVCAAVYAIGGAVMKLHERIRPTARRFIRET